ncbi:group III truncated hemoglobin [Fulvimonas yonginensis]|uniref:Group III truncated hemoglobin n=1 Tax=Fulvimonas yonginensis TaxID=1495200 RepID=A0ABU8JEC0_9GAMM
MRDTTLTETAIARLVDRFYDKVTADPVLGPVFNPVVHDWPEHKRLLTRFWCSVALGDASYRGNPMAVHRPLPIRAEHFDHWLGLWRATCVEVLDETDAARMVDYAQRIGRSLKYGLGLHPEARGIGVPLMSVSR